MLIPKCSFNIKSSNSGADVPPLGNNTNPDDKLEFVLFFSNEYFGIKVDLNGKKKKLPGV